MQGVNFVGILFQTHQQNHILWEEKKIEHHRIQDMPLQNTAPWHSEYFKGGIWETADPRGTLRPSPIKQVMWLSDERCPPTPRGTEILNKKALLNFPSFLHLVHTLMSHHIFLKLYTFHRTSYIKMLRFNCFFGSFVSLWRLPCHVNILNKCICFSSVNLSFVIEA